MYGLEICIGTGFDVCEITSCLLPITHSTLFTNSWFIHGESLKAFSWDPSLHSLFIRNQVVAPHSPIRITFRGTMELRNSAVSLSHVVV